MYNLVIVVILIMLLFFLSHDTKFAMLFTKNNSFQIIAGIILLYFSLNEINFGILLIVTVLMILRYSYINTNVLGPLKNKYKTPLLKDIYNIIDKFMDNDNNTTKTNDNITKENTNDLHIQSDRKDLAQLFANMDKKMDYIIQKADR